MISQDTATFLGGMRLFAGIDPQRIHELSPFIDNSHYRKGQIILIRGEVPTALHIVRCGSAVAELSRAQVAAFFMKEGDFFGESSVFEEGSADSTVRAASDGTAVLQISWEPLKRLLDEHPAMAERLRASAACRRAGLGLLGSLKSNLTLDTRAFVN